MTNLLDRGEKFTQMKERMMSKLESNELFRNDDQYDLTTPQQREATMRKVYLQQF